MVRVIIDTNLWISALIGKRTSELQNLFIEKPIRPIFSQGLLDELIVATQKPKLQKYFRPERVNALILTLHKIGEVVEIRSTVTVCRDPKDNYLLALAKDSRADYLVTGDLDLLILQEFEGTRILTYQDFLQAIDLDQ
jgi:putative PIN family toxin of toxin-antitoxin system